ncbi:MAG: Yip1 family protein [Myxococcaceae bacterium]
MVEQPSGGSMCAVHPSVPAVHTCPRCGSFACADCLVYLPDGAQVCRACEGRARQDALPWDRRSEVGFWRAYWQTSVAVISKPTLTFGTMAKDGSLGSSLAFTAVSQVASFATTLLLYAVAISLMLIIAPDDPAMRKGFGSLGQGASGALIVGVVFVGFFFYLAMVAFIGVMTQLIAGSLEHLVLKQLGGTASWTETMRGYSIAMGPSLIGLVPVCGIYVFPIWSVVMRVFAYKHVHNLSWGRAVAGALIPTAVLVCLCGGAYAALISAAIAAAPKH